MSASKAFTQFSNSVAHAAGKPVTFVLCVLVILGWAASGPIFSFSDTWQLIINTSTTIITFLMVFLIQNTQNRDGAAMQAKLDELIRASDSRNQFVGIEHLTQEELDKILAEAEERAKGEGDHETAAKLADRRARNRSRAPAPSLEAFFCCAANTCQRRGSRLSLARNPWFVAGSSNGPSAA